MAAVNPDSPLASRLRDALPAELHLIIHHVCSLPTPCPAIFSPPHGQSEESTCCESHFLAISIDNNGIQVQAFALEVLIYTTTSLTILFVSKADSTGYLHLLNVSKSIPSPLRTTISEFLKYLVETRQRKGIRLVLSLFARAQDQYLFPGSIENTAKHVLDDRGLIRWWCKILDTVVREFPVEIGSDKGDSTLAKGDGAIRSRAYLRVPGCDSYETRAFFPEYAKREQASNLRWFASDPLRGLGKPATTPERCLIPRFPDDPKARFVSDLDDELPEHNHHVQGSPIKSLPPGKWRSVGSLEQFWDMMAFRQECAAGRLVGFLWGVFTPSESIDKPFDYVFENVEGPVMKGVTDIALPMTVAAEIPRDVSTVLGLQTLPTNTCLAPSLLRDAPSRLPQDKLLFANKLSFNDPTWSVNSAEEPRPADVISQARIPDDGCIVLEEKAYKRCMDLLLQLDYADLTLASESTRKWVNAVAGEAHVKRWDVVIVGKGKSACVRPNNKDGSSADGVATLDASIIKRRKRPGEDESGAEPVTVLGQGLVRKKPKIDASTDITIT